MAREVYGLDAPLTTLARYEPVASSDLGWASHLMGTTSGHLLVERAGLEVWVDPWTGEEVEDPAGFRPSQAPVPPAPPPEWEGYEGGHTGEVGLISAILRLPTGSLKRVLAVRDGVWGLVEGPCVELEVLFFHLDGELWSGHSEHGVLSWGRWREVP